MNNIFNFESCEAPNSILEPIYEDISYNFPTNKTTDVQPNNMDTNSTEINELKELLDSWNLGELLERLLRKNGHFQLTAYLQKLQIITQCQKEC